VDAVVSGELLPRLLSAHGARASAHGA
jgi:hypothetical protein